MEFKLNDGLIFYLNIITIFSFIHYACRFLSYPQLTMSSDRTEKFKIRRHARVW